MKVLPGNQFPVEAYDNFVKQIVPRWLDTDAPIIAAYTELVDKVCPCVILSHSQAGAFGVKVAQARPDKVKALVAVEPAVPGDVDKAAALKGIPILMVFGGTASRVALAQDAAGRRDIRRRRARGRWQRGCRRSSRGRHQGQLAHAHDG